MTLHQESKDPLQMWQEDVSIKKELGIVGFGMQSVQRWQLGFVALLIANISEGPVTLSLDLPKC